MTARVEVLNAGVNRTNIRVRHVRVEVRNGLSVIVDLGDADALQAVPGNRATGRADCSSSTMLLIEELPRYLEAKRALDELMAQLA